MGILRSILGAKIASKAIDYIDSKNRMPADYIPAKGDVRKTADQLRTRGADVLDQARTRGSAMADRATAIAKQNPKLVTAGAGVLAVVLAGVLAARKNRSV